MLPKAFEERMLAMLGPEEYAAFLAASERPRAAALRLNPLKTDGIPDLPFLREPVPWARYGFYYDPDARPGLHPWHEAGVYYLQEASAMAPAGLLDPKPGERVLDLCAAPGGKSTQLAGLMRGSGLLVCNEINPKRAQVLSRNVERLGIANALVTNMHPAALAQHFGAWFDRVLVDAPCSGEGMFRKEEAASADWSPETVAMCARRQDEILDSAASMLKPGGRLVYSTCTFAPEEDEGTVERFLARHPEFSLADTGSPYFAPGRPEWAEGGSPELTRCLRLWPHRLLGEGHFAAVLEKQGGSPDACTAEEPAAELPQLCREFCAESLPGTPEGIPVRFGDRVFCAPYGTPVLHGLKVLRPGLELGCVEKGRFTPAHALALHLKEAAHTADFAAESAEIARYMAGEVLPGEGKGWTLITAGGFSLGWAKASGGQLKNHYPKGLRRAIGR